MWAYYHIFRCTKAMLKWLLSLWCMYICLSVYIHTYIPIHLALTYKWSIHSFVKCLLSIYYVLTTAAEVLNFPSLPFQELCSPVIIGSFTVLYTIFLRCSGCCGNTGGVFKSDLGIGNLLREE